MPFATSPEAKKATTFPRGPTDPQRAEAITVWHDGETKRLFDGQET